jgi:hypothetical protein
MRIFWSRRAVGHLSALRDYIAEDSPASAAAVARRILEAAELLAAQPHLGRPGRIAGTRELVGCRNEFVTMSSPWRTHSCVPRRPLLATPGRFFQSHNRCREESRHSTQEWVRHELG